MQEPIWPLGLSRKSLAKSGPKSQKSLEAGGSLLRPHSGTQISHWRSREPNQEAGEPLKALTHSLAHSSGRVRQEVCRKHMALFLPYMALFLPYMALFLPYRTRTEVGAQ